MTHWDTRKEECKYKGVGGKYRNNFKKIFWRSQNLGCLLMTVLDGEVNLSLTLYGQSYIRMRTL